MQGVPKQVAFLLLHLQNRKLGHDQNSDELRWDGLHSGRGGRFGCEWGTERFRDREPK